jgi:hypothetical protein
MLILTLKNDQNVSVSQQHPICCCALSTSDRMVTKLWAGWPQIKVWLWEQQEIFLPAVTFRPSLRSNNPPIQYEGFIHWEHGSQGMRLITQVSLVSKSNCNYSSTSTWGPRFTVDYSIKSLMVPTIYGWHMCNSEILVVLQWILIRLC